MVEVLGACQLIKHAWIGKAEPDGTLRVLAWSRDYPRSMREDLRWDDSPRGRRTSGQAVREDRTVVVHDLLKGPISSVRREDLRRSKVRSTAATPVRRLGQRWGVLVLHAGEAQVVDGDLTRLLESLGRELGRWLDDLECREQLAESHHHLNLAMQIAHLGLWSWSEETGLEWLDTHELGPNMLGGVHKDDRDAFERALRAGKPDQGVLRVGGKYFKYWMESAPPRMVGVLQDVTRTRQTLVDLKRRDDRFRVALQNSPVTVYELDDQLCYNFVQHTCGPYVESDVLGKSPTQLDGPRALALEKAMREVLATGESRQVEYEARDQYYSCTLEARRDDEGKIVGILGSSVNLTELRRAEKEARLLSYAVNQTTLPFMVTDQAGTIQYCNPHFHALSGYGPEECRGQRPAVLMQMEPELAERVRTTLASGQTWSGEVHITRKDGQKAWEWVSIAPVLNEDGTVEQFVAVSQDITELKRSAEALAAAQRELAQAHKLEAVGRLAGGVAHDFNNLLASIIGNCERELLERSSSGLEEALGAARRAAALTQQLVSFSRGQQLEPIWVDLNRELQALEPGLNRTAANVELVLELSGEPLEVELDATLLEITVKALAENAVQAMPAGGRLTLRTRRQEGAALLELVDTGEGMTPEVKEHLFEPFFSTRGGRGLGLATVYGIVCQSGGVLAVDSVLGAGTTVRITLPTRALPAPALQPAQTRILLVEDQPDLLNLFSLLLAQKGFQVEQAISAEKALEKGADFDLLISDVSLTGMDGFELARRLRAANPKLRVVLMSGYTDSPADLEFELVAKPFTPDELYRHVSEAFLKPPGE